MVCAHIRLKSAAVSVLGREDLSNVRLVGACSGRIANVTYHICLVVIYKSSLVESFAGFRQIVVNRGDLVAKGAQLVGVVDNWLTLHVQYRRFFGTDSV